MEISWKSHGNPKETSREPHGNLIETSWKCLVFLMEISWKYHGFIMEVLGNIMEISWKSHGNFMEISWKSNGNLLSVSWHFLRAFSTLSRPIETSLTLSISIASQSCNFMLVWQSCQLSLKKFFDTSSLSRRKGRDREWNKKRKKSKIMGKIAVH